MYPPASAAPAVLIPEIAEKQPFDLPPICHFGRSQSLILDSKLLIPL
ncbi:MAG: hypothetical protein WBD50_05790 [Candidatus Rhabdochlamydia sp.]